MYLSLARTINLRKFVTFATEINLELGKRKELHRNEGRLQPVGRTRYQFKCKSQCPDLKPLSCLLEYVSGAGGPHTVLEQGLDSRESFAGGGRAYC